MEATSAYARAIHFVNYRLLPRTAKEAIDYTTELMRLYYAAGADHLTVCYAYDDFDFGHLALDMVAARMRSNFADFTVMTEYKRTQMFLAIKFSRARH